MPELLSFIPTGWFQVAGRRDIAEGEVLPPRHLGTGFVVGRDNDGQVPVWYAHCHDINVPENPSYLDKPAVTTSKKGFSRHRDSARSETCRAIGV